MISATTECRGVSDSIFPWTPLLLDIFCFWLEWYCFFSNLYCGHFSIHDNDSWTYAILALVDSRPKCRTASSDRWSWCTGASPESSLHPRWLGSQWQQAAVRSRQEVVQQCCGCDCCCWCCGFYYLLLHQIWNKTSLSTFTMISSTSKLPRISDFRSGLKILLPLLHFYTLVVNWEFCSKWILSILPQGEIGWVPFHDGSNFEAIFKHEELCAQ